MYHIPKERVIIDTISLDQEIQLERELIEEEYRPIQAAWDAWLPRQTWPQPLPMSIWEPSPWHRLNHLQLAFVRHLNFEGEPYNPPTSLGFQTGLEHLRDLYRDLSMDLIIESANLMWGLQQECEKGAA